MDDSTPALIYLDHNVLDALVKERYPSLKHALIHERLQVVYSDESLYEISKSIGFEEQFMKTLVDLKAKHISAVLDDQHRVTDTASLDSRDPCDVYTTYRETIADAPTQDFGLFALLQKFFGGRSEETFADITRQAGQELHDLLETLKQDMATVELPNLIDRNKARQDIGDLQRLFPGMIGSLGTQLDNQEHLATVASVEVSLDAGPKVLQNLKGPRILEQIWDRNSGTLPGGEMPFERFFGLVGPNDQPRRALEKINSIYHQLNVLGYYRDKRLPHKLQGSLSDMSHAGMASFCQVFMCFDMRLSKKAKAAYEHLKVSTILFPDFG
jgi:hypothetical protein